MPATSLTSLARQSCTALAPSVHEPPPTVMITSAFTARAISVAAITASRGVCCGISSKIAAQRSPSARSIFAIASVCRRSVPETIRKAREAPSRSICLGMASAAGSPNTTSSIAPKTTRPLCTRLSSRDVLLVLEGRLAKERWRVMPEDRHLRARLAGCKRRQAALRASSAAIRSHNLRIMSFITSASCQRSESSAPSGPVMA